MPVPELRSSTGEVSLIFVSAINLYFEQPSQDPIFPAPRRITLSIGDNFEEEFWTTDTESATVLGCVDYATVCKENGQSRGCYDIGLKHDLPNMARWTETDIETFHLLYSAMVFSHVRGAIHQRGSEALAIRDLANGAFIIAIPSDHWLVEMSKIFRTSIARGRVEVLSSVNGVFANQPGFDSFDDPSRGMCKMVLVNASGHRNVSVWGVTLILSYAIMVFVCAIKIKHKYVVVKILWRYICKAYKALRWIVRQVISITINVAEMCRSA